MTLIKKMENFSTALLPKKMTKQTVQEKTKNTENKSTCNWTLWMEKKIVKERPPVRSEESQKERY